MSALKEAEPVFPAPRIDSVPTSDTWQSHTARAVTRWGRAGAVISVNGELDAANAGQLAEHVHHCATSCQWLVLDLSDVEFIGTAGFSALREIVDRCTDTLTYCTTVPGPVVTRLLRICDPVNTLPTTSSVAEALAAVPGLRRVH